LARKHDPSDRKAAVERRKAFPRPAQAGCGPTKGAPFGVPPPSFHEGGKLNPPFTQQQLRATSALAYSTRQEISMTPEERQLEAQQRQREKDAIWRGIYHVMGDAIEGWRSCSVKACRRNRKCSSDSFACLEKKRRENEGRMTPEEQAQSMHELRLMVDARLAELRGQARAEEATVEAMPRRKRAVRRDENDGGCGMR